VVDLHEKIHSYTNSKLCIHNSLPPKMARLKVLE